MGNTKIARTNKDLIAKILADSFGEKSFSVYGINLPPIERCLPTEFPDVQVKDRISDRLFLLQDGSYALVDFESRYLRANKVKYLHYITRVLDWYLDDDSDFHLRFIVLYMGNVQSAQADFTTDCVTIHTEQAFLSHINGDLEFEKIAKKLEAGEELTDEDLMRIIILPLTYSDKDQQVRMVDEMIQTADRIRDDEKRSFVLAGICVAADTFMTLSQSIRIGGLLKMTKVGRMLMEEMEEMEAQVEAHKTLLKEQKQLLQEQDQRLQQQKQLLQERDQQLQQQDQQLQQQDQQLQQQDGRQ